MPLTGPTVRASVLSVMPQYTHDRCVDITTLMNEVGIDHHTLKSANARVPLNSVGRLFELVARELADDAFGLSYAKAFPPGASGLLGHLMLTAPTVRDLFLVLTRYTQVHTTSVLPSYEMRDGVGWFTFSWPTQFCEPLIHYTAFSLGTLVLRVRRAAGPNWTPLMVEFQHREPPALDGYREMFGTRLKFNCPSNCLAVDASTLARPMPEILPMLAESLKDLGDRQLKELVPEDDVATRLKLVMATRLETEQPFDLDTVATALGMQARSMQWRLAQQETNYENVLLVTRLLMAERYLRDNDYQQTRIASLLGFSEQSAFTRWCQRHFGMSPSSYRRWLRSAGGMGSVTEQDAT